MKTAATSATGEGTARAVAGFYEKLVFPSRSSHAAYAQFIPSQPGERLGDFGCGQSLFYEALRRYTPAPTFLDLSMNALRTIDYGLRVRADLRRLPFPDATYDRILCVGVLHHLPERRPLLREMARVLRPGGLLVLGVYAPRTLQSRLRGLYVASGWRAWRRLVFGLTSLLIALRYRGTGRAIAAEEVRLRASDFLDVPFVQYADPDVYLREAAAEGLLRTGMQRIAAMNILLLQQRGARP